MTNVTSTRLMQKLVTLILFGTRKPYTHSKTNKFVFALTFGQGEANLEIDV